MCKRAGGGEGGCEAKGRNEWRDKLRFGMGRFYRLPESIFMKHEMRV